MSNAQQKHTRGWLQVNHRDPFQICDGGEHDRGCAPVAWMAGETDAEKKANARRLVACWNACEGITTEELERIAGTGGMVGPRDDVARIAAKRDELLAALEAAVELYEVPASWVPQAADLIAKVKGGAL